MADTTERVGNRDECSKEAHECLEFIRQCVSGRCNALDLDVIENAIKFWRNKAHAPTPAPPPTKLVGVPVDELLMEIVKHTERGTVEDAIRLVKLGRLSSSAAMADLRKEAEATSPPPEEGGWISVEDRLPKMDGITYLVYRTEYQTGIRYVDTFTAQEQAAWHNKRKNLASGITHWRPLPAPPVSSDKAARSHTRRRNERLGC